MSVAHLYKQWQRLLARKSKNRHIPHLLSRSSLSVNKHVIVTIYPRTSMKTISGPSCYPSLIVILNVLVNLTRIVFSEGVFDG